MARERLDSTRSRPLSPDEARLMEDNSRLAWWAANRVLRRVMARNGFQGNTETLFEDLVDAALFGLSLAAKTYHPERGSFSTFAATVMTGECNRFLTRGGLKLPPAEVHLLSLSEVIAGEGPDGAAVSEFIADPNAPDPAEYASRRALPQVLGEALAALPEREAEIIRRRFLLDESLEKIAQALGRSRQRIYQIERQALGHLRGVLQQRGYAAAGDLI